MSTGGPLPVTSQTLDVCIRAEVLNGTWETFGVDRAIEVDPESVSYGANEWGCEKASFTLRRNPWAAWPDLSPFTPVEIEIGGVIVWEGRTEGTPLKAGAEASINVQAGGWAQHLDDDLYKRLYVHATLSDWKDIRSSVEAPLASFSASPQVLSETGVITLSFPKGSPVTLDVTRVGVYLDLGEAGAAKTVSVTFGESTFVAGYYTLFAFAGPSVEAYLAEELWQFDAGTPVTPSTATLTTSERYVFLFIVRTGETAEENGDRSLKITAISVFGEAAYESAGASVLKASTVIENALAEATKLLSSDLSQIDTAADEFDIPTLVMANYKTSREMITAVNAFHNWVTAIDLERRMVFAPPSTEPLLEWGSWSGEELEDPSAGEGADIYNRVLVEGTEADSDPVDVAVTAAEVGATTVVDQRGFRRSKAISLANATNPTVAKEIGEVWLDDQLVIPFAGAIKANVGSLRTVLGGQPVHPSLMVRHVNELLRVSHMIDPSTGGVGRDGRIVSVSYEHATQSAQITLGSRTDSIEALLARLAVVEEGGS